MRTRRTKDQIRKDNYNKDVDAYNFYVVNLDTKRAETGFQFREDAVDLLNDYDDKKKYKVVSKRALKTMGIENPNESFKYIKGGNIKNEIAFKIQNDYIGYLDLGFYNIPLSEDYVAYNSFFTLSDATKELFDYLKSDDGIALCKYNPKSNFSILKLYPSGKKDYRGDNEIIDKTVFKISAKEVDNLRSMRRLEFGGDFQAGVYAGGGEIDSKNITLAKRLKVKKWYTKTYSTDDLGQEINEDLSFWLFWSYLSQGYNVYSVLEVSDSLVRERVFQKLSEILEVDYDVIYKKWLNSDKYIDGGDFQAGVYAKGGSLEAHGIEIGDTFIKTISGGIHKVKDKNGKIVYIDLSNGERDTQPPLPFENGGGVDDGIEEDIDMTDDYVLRVRKPAMPNRKLSNLELAEKHNSGAYEFMGQDKMMAGGSLNDHELFLKLKNSLKPNKRGANESKLLGYTMYEKNGEYEITRRIDGNEVDVTHLFKKFFPYKSKSKMAGGNVSNFKIGDEVTIIKPFPNGDMTGKKGKIVELSVNNTGVIYILVDGKRIAVLSEYISKNKMATGGALVGNQSRIDMNHNGKIDAEDFKLLRSSMNGAWRNERKHVNHSEDYEVRYAKPRPNRTGYKGKRKFGEGGGISNFERLSRVVAKNYEGKRVKPAYQKEYGKVYSKSEAKEVGNKVAGKMKIMKKAESGTMVKKGNRGGIMSLAKQIRKEGESWQDALKRAGQQLK